MWLERNSKPSKWSLLAILKHLPVYLLFSTFRHADPFSELEELKSSLILPSFKILHMLMTHFCHQQNALNWKRPGSDIIDLFSRRLPISVLIIKYYACWWVWFYLQCSKCNLNLIWTNKAHSVLKQHSCLAKIP